MAKRIFRNVVLTAIIAVLLTNFLTVFTMYNAYEESITQELRQEAEYVTHALESSADQVSYLKGLATNNRITLIENDGMVIFDNAAKVSIMENHINRPEVVMALENGWGESTRTSDTVSEVTLYYAQRMTDGRILRIANTRSSIVGTFAGVLPMIIGMLALVVLLSLINARRAAKRIVAPINTLNLEKPLENEAYDELAPLLTRMDRQHSQINKHVKELQTARSELAAIMDNMREGMILLDSKDHILSMNQSAADIFCVSPTAHIGENLLSVSRDANLYDVLQDALSGNVGGLTMERNTRYYQIFASPVMRNEQIRGAVLLVLDITERFAAEESRREFTANVSHELKTPLTSISGFAEIIRDGIAQPQDIPHFAGMICKESARLIALVNDILDLSKLDEKQNLGQSEDVEIMPLLQSLVDDFSLSAQKKDLDITLSGDETQIKGFPVLLREMFFNLIDNAVKYTPDGGSVKLNVTQYDDVVQCVVSDTGIGIAQEHIPHVFERFYRVDKSHSRQTGGTGLGLSIVKHIAQIHKAEISLESTPQIGTTITICFAKKA